MDRVDVRQGRDIVEEGVVEVDMMEEIFDAVHEEADSVPEVELILELGKPDVGKRSVYVVEVDDPVDERLSLLEDAEVNDEAREFIEEEVCPSCRFAFFG